MAPDKRITFVNPLDATTWKASQTVVRGAFPVDPSTGAAYIQPVVLVDPSSNPITASGALGSVSIEDANTPSNKLAIDSNGQIGVNNLPGRWPNSTASATVNGSTAVQLIAARGAGVKSTIYKITCYTPSAPGSAGKVSVGDNSATYNNIVTGFYKPNSLVNGLLADIDFPGGFPQPTANAAIYILTAFGDTTTVVTAYYS